MLQCNEALLRLRVFNLLLLAEAGGEAMDSVVLCRTTNQARKTDSPPDQMIRARDQTTGRIAKQMRLLSAGS